MYHDEMPKIPIRTHTLSPTGCWSISFRHHFEKFSKAFACVTPGGMVALSISIPRHKASSPYNLKIQFPVSTKSLTHVDAIALNTSMHQYQVISLVPKRMTNINWFTTFKVFSTSCTRWWHPSNRWACPPTALQPDVHGARACSSLLAALMIFILSKMKSCYVCHCFWNNSILFYSILLENQSINQLINQSINKEWPSVGPLLIGPLGKTVAMRAFKRVFVSTLVFRDTKKIFALGLIIMMLRCYFQPHHCS